LKLQTRIQLSPEKNQIDYESKILLLGSCFSENIGGKLEYFKFQNLQNPFGIIFNPVSILGLVERAVRNEYFTEADIFQKEENWYSFEVHSSIWAESEATFIAKLNSILQQFREYLTVATHIVLTYGTAWVYRNNTSGLLVANCHKVVQKYFSKEMLSVKTISASLENTIALIKKENPSVTIITTVSPVRHSKNGIVENSRSKAHLITALHQVVGTKEGLYYFPSFELMMDELRDYRFYEQDMLHPNETAIQIIWEKFRGTWVVSETETLQKEIDTIQKGLRHKPFYPESASHRAFLKNLRKKISVLQERVSHLTFSK
jgi:GSCFA family